MSWEIISEPPAGKNGFIKSFMNVWMTVFQAKAATSPKAEVERDNI